MLCTHMLYLDYFECTIVIRRSMSHSGKLVQTDDSDKTVHFCKSHGDDLRVVEGT